MGRKQLSTISSIILSRLQARAHSVERKLIALENPEQMVLHG
jgi:hypothetical protein